MRRFGTNVMAAAALAAITLVGVDAEPSPAAAPATVRVSVSTTGVQANAAVRLAGVSADGRYVLMNSKASTLVAGDTNAVQDVFVRDTETSRTSRVSVSSSGGQANGPSYANAISSDGRFVVFTSDATNLSVARDTNRASDVFVRDRTLGITRRVSIRKSGRQFSFGTNGVAVSDDGRYVQFAPYAYVRDRVAKTTTRFGAGTDWYVSGCGLSPDGRLVAYWEFSPGRLTRSYLVIVERATHTYVMGDSDVVGGRVSFTPTASLAAYEGDFGASVIVRRPDDPTTSLAYIWDVGDPQLTASGGALSFVGYYVVAGDTNDKADLYVRDLATGATVRVSLADSGEQIAAGIRTGVISADGRWAVFSSADGGVVADDTNRTSDVFLRGPLT